MANKTLLISPQVVEQYVSFAKNLDSNYVRCAIELAQDKGLQVTIGSKLLRRLQQMIDTNTLNDDYRELLEEYITPYMVWECLSELVLTLHYKIKNAGITSNYGEHLQTASLSEANTLKEEYKQNANFYTSRLVSFLHANHSKYPEYHSCDTTADIHSNDKNYHIPLA